MSHTQRSTPEPHPVPAGPAAPVTSATGPTDPRHHPRPALARAAWTSLDGTWAFARGHDPHRAPESWDQTIQVPFAPEAPASGIGAVDERPVVWYATTVTVPAAWEGQRVWLRFGAVDGTTTVWVNRQRVGEHELPYLPFGFDVSDEAPPGSEARIVVRASDDPAAMTVPRGKQDWLPTPHAIWYPRTSGIWRSVWLEALPQRHLAAARFDTVAGAFALDLRAEVAGILSAASGSDLSLSVQAWRVPPVPSERLADATPEPEPDRPPDLHDRYALTGTLLRRRLHLPDPGIDDARNAWLWSPERPTRIRVRLALLDGDREVDVAWTTTALRSLTVRDGALQLNGRPRRPRMVLDQGYWPDTHLTPRNSEALGQDVSWAKRLGFDGVRKHQKLEDPRFYAWADRAGLLVWVEVPSAYAFDEDAVRRTAGVLSGAIREAAPHASVAAWVPVNESWGVPDLPESRPQRNAVRMLCALARTLDPTRPVVGNDGWEIVDGDLINLHDYERDPARLRARYGSAEAIQRTLTHFRPSGRTAVLRGDPHDGRPVLLTEFGGMRIAGDGDGDENGAWGYHAVPDADAFLRRYRELVAAVLDGALAGFCYTQLTDTFQERNGLLDMHRRPKADPGALAAATRGEGREEPQTP